MMERPAFVISRCLVDTQIVHDYGALIVLGAFGELMVVSM